MDTARHDFNNAAAGIAGPTSIDWLIVWAAIIGDGDREARRRAWDLECKRRRRRGLYPRPPWPRP